MLRSSRHGARSQRIYTLHRTLHPGQSLIATVTVRPVSTSTRALSYTAGAPDSCHLGQQPSKPSINITPYSGATL